MEGGLKHWVAQCCEVLYCCLANSRACLQLVEDDAASDDGFIRLYLLNDGLDKVLG